MISLISKLSRECYFDRISSISRQSSPFCIQDLYILTTTLSNMSSLRQLAARNELVSWQVAPAEYEIANYDEPNIRYRAYVENFIKSLPKKSVTKRTFFTISTNVLCADIQSSKNTIDPIDRDIYLPLEISIAKWSLTDGKVSENDRELKIKHWMVNPGRPTRGSNCYALAHSKKHKIYWDATDDSQNIFIKKDMTELMKEINCFLSPDRTVYSLSLRHARQDLGCLKWLNRESGYKTKPINVYSLEDLYVVLIRSFNPDMKSTIGQGIARFRMNSIGNALDIDGQCEYHKMNARQDPDRECQYCTKALVRGYSNILISDVFQFGNLFDPTSGDQQVQSKTQSPTKNGPPESPSKNIGF